MELSLTEQLKCPDPRDHHKWFTRPTWLIRLGRPIAACLLPWLADITLVGTEHLPPTGPFVLAANHASALDSVILDALLPRYPFFMAKRELFRNPAAAWFLRHAGAFPVERGNSDAWAIQQALRVLQSGQALGIYPEGTRSKRKGALGRAKTGAVRIALQQNVPVVPVAISGTDALLNKRTTSLHRPQVALCIGEPFDVCSRVTKRPVPYETVRALTTELMQRIAQMLSPEKRGEYTT